MQTETKHKSPRFYLDIGGNVVDRKDSWPRTPIYVRDELGFSRAEMQVIADLCSERNDMNWGQINDEWEKRTGKVLS